MKTKKREIPSFADENEERIFWETHDSAEYIDWNSAQKVVLPNLRPTLKSISLRLPEPLLARIRTMANERDIPYQSLIKMILAEHVQANADRHIGRY